MRRDKPSASGRSFDWLTVTCTRPANGGGTEHTLGRQPPRCQRTPADPGAAITEASREMVAQSHVLPSMRCLWMTSPTRRSGTERLVLAPPVWVLPFLRPGACAKLPACDVIAVAFSALRIGSCCSAMVPLASGGLSIRRVPVSRLATWPAWDIHQQASRPHGCPERLHHGGGLVAVPGRYRFRRDGSRHERRGVGPLRR
jgi:hypothetical protein